MFHSRPPSAEILKMVSRRKILSRSTDDLNIEAPGLTEPEEEDVWFNKEKLYKAIIE